MIDPGYSETAAVADLNNDGKPDIISSESWYEAPNWTKHPLRSIDYATTIFGSYIDNFTDIPFDVDGDGWTDVIQFSYFARNIVWLKNPGKTGGPWKVTEIDSPGQTEFAFLVDLNNDGKAQELLPELDRTLPLAWYELQNGKYIKHVVASHQFGHGIGVGDINGDGRNDIITPQGWLEAPADVRAAGEWKFHPTDWDQHPLPAAGRNVPVPTLAPGRGSQFGYMYVLDINGDGRPDVLTTYAHDYGIVWFEHTSDDHWIQHTIDNTWSQAHASALVDLNGDGQPDLVTGKRYYAQDVDPGQREPNGLYWYEYRRVTPTAATATSPGNGGVEWIRHIIDYGSRTGGGLQIVVTDIDGDGDLDVVSGGKAGLFLAENLTKLPKSSAAKTR